MKPFTVVYWVLGILVASILLVNCNNAPSTNFKVAATAVPHAEILEQARQVLKEKGIELEIVVVEDYNTPNRALQDGEVKANFFQHYPFLQSQIQDFGYQLEPLVSVHAEPMGLYSKKMTDLSTIQSGALIAIPSDPTNQARALMLMEKLGWITLKRQDSKASLLDLASNPLQLRWVEVESPLLIHVLEDVDLAAITTNFALQAGLSPQKDALTIEGSDSLFANIVVIRQGEKQEQDIQALKEALTSPHMRQFIETYYQGAVIPTF